MAHCVSLAGSGLPRTSDVTHGCQDGKRGCRSMYAMNEKVQLIL